MGYLPPERSGRPELRPRVHQVCGTSNREIGWGYVKQVEIVVMTARLVGSGLRPSKGSGVDEEMVMSQQAMRQAARRSALDAQAVLRKERADRERRLERLAVAVLTALGERDAAVRDAERRAGAALQTMTNDEDCRWGRWLSGAEVAALRCGR